MKIFIDRIIIKNRAPFENGIDLTFDENEIAVLTAVNGRGKTTILSYIVDAWYEMVRPHFQQEFEDKENKYYRISSSVFNINQSAPSFVYIRFVTLTQIRQEEYTENNNKHISRIEHGQTLFYIKDFIDYVDIRNKCTEDEYDKAIVLDEKIAFSAFQNDLKNSNCVKKVSDTFTKEFADSTFKNVITYFPAYRYENPGYLNDPYKVHLDFTKESSFSGYLTNPLEVVTGISQLANWIMDVVLDMDLYKQTQTIPLPTGEQRTIDLTPERNVLWHSLNTIIQQTLSSKKFQGTLRFGIGKRNSGVARISIVKDWTQDGQTQSQQYYPTIFNLSSGETALLSLFGEILRQADKIQNNIILQQIKGIVLIDEVDKHLHIKLQKEVLPLLFNLFPNIQFIVSSHSPFLNMGLAEKSHSRAKIIDLDNFGISTDPTSNKLYKEVYEMIINENDKFAEKYRNLSRQIQQSSKPLIITEGKTDIKHLKKAQEKLGIIDCDVEYCEIPDKLV